VCSDVVLVETGLSGDGMPPSQGTLSPQTALQTMRAAPVGEALVDYALEGLIALQELHQVHLLVASCLECCVVGHCLLDGLLVSLLLGRGRGVSGSSHAGS
jgi:hypothetical protein